MVTRKVDAASRSSIPDEWDEFRRKDKIESWTYFVDNIQTCDIVSSNDLCVTFDSQKSFVILSSFKGEHVLFSVHISSDFNVKAFYLRTPVKIRDLLGYQCRLQFFSELDLDLDHS